MIIIPKYIFIVPYRNRSNQKQHFDIYMKYIMEDYNDNEYFIYYSHQTDYRSFNRGAVKNIGFLAMKQKYPNNYKDIIFIFNDIDTMPYIKNTFNYNTKKGEIKHFYGFNFALGGIFSITGEDFEKINGFPNYWGWGLEDNCIQKRAIHYNININRDEFLEYKNNKVLQFDIENKKIITKNPISIANNKNILLYCGLISLVNISFDIVNSMINISSFDDKFIPFKNEKFIIKDIETTGNIIKDTNKNYLNPIIKMKLNN